jgi:hypothetical protein
MRWRHGEENSGKSEGRPAVLKFPTACRTRSFSIVFARSHYPIFSRATLIESTTSYSTDLSVRVHLLGPVTFSFVPTFPSYLSFRSSDYNCFRNSQPLILLFPPTSPLVTHLRSPCHSFPRHCQSMPFIRGTNQILSQKFLLPIMKKITA